MNAKYKLTGFQQSTPELDSIIEPIYDALVANGVRTLDWRDFRIGFIAGLASQQIVVEVDDTTKEAGA